MNWFISPPLGGMRTNGATAGARLPDFTICARSSMYCMQSRRVRMSYGLCSNSAAAGWCFLCQRARLRQRGIHHFALHAGAGGQFDDIAVGIAEIDRADKTVVDRPAYFYSLRPPFLQHRIE